MASRRSRSPSTPSEGEIIESGSETKATTSQTSLNDINVDRNPRNEARSPKSPGSVGRSSRRDRSRSRSPYRASRGEKRRRDDHDYERGSRRALNPRHDDRYYSRNESRRQRQPYYDHDRSETYNRYRLSYNDDYDRRAEKRPRTRSRSPYRESRKQKRYSDEEAKDERPSAGSAGGRLRHEGRRLSTEQSVSERRNPSVDAQKSRQETEFRGTQMQQAFATESSVSNDPAPRSDVTTEDEVPSEPVDEAALIERRRKRREAIKAKYRGQATPLLVQALQIGTETGSTASNASESASKADSSARQGSPANTPDETSAAQSPTDLHVSRDEDLANTDLQNRSGIEKEEASAADYDPTADMRQEKMRHDKRQFNEDMSASAYDETKVTKQEVLVPEPTAEQPNHMKAKDPFDMFAEDDDMFAEEPPTTMTQNEQSQVPILPSVAQPQELDMSMMDNWDDPEGYYNVMLGELINGRYHVQQNLGKGMFSSVVRAMDSKTGKLVAVKIIRNNDTMRKAGFKEIEILQQLRAADPEDRKHIIKFERQFEHKAHLCMVFENLSMNLREVLKKFGRDVGINLRAIRAYAQQMFLGLSLLRKCNILHADLKPDNLLVNENRNLLKLCDLGSASPVTENEITPYLVSRFYRAPEIILGIPYDYAIDVWSIGCTLFELYSGKILFTGRTNNQMLRSMMECRGKFPPKFLRRGSLTHLHFDDLLNFHSLEEDKITGRMVTKILDFKKPTRDLKSRLMGKGARLSDAETKEINLFIDLLDRCLSLNPEKRCTPSEALRHPFIARTKT
ncbi:serine/threonine-protein kinase prp4 [Uncinocarpus reesii 1704]|uniref:non-specific serine/threonine protein kinase n=1 Tax=Uncinocarpus reesii (strain UAMH 1704) TaxID=336963 RepID=C4JYY0_UNCRE|nr:serine/threonine-protein kinase prp4 [Uncinocarpus reesii 1704]EEP82516.1 serine/threonine-protein kinase prp4 [Uncinocarpus reesii 1704]